jgi:hypothetical protein
VVERFGLINSAKLGIIIGMGWGLIFAGCMANTRDAITATKLTIAILIVIVVIVITAPQWAPGFFGKKNVDKIGGGTGEVEDDDANDETDP